MSAYLSTRGLRLDILVPFHLVVTGLVNKRVQTGEGKQLIGIGELVYTAALSGSFRR